MNLASRLAALLIALASVIAPAAANELRQQSTSAYHFDVLMVQTSDHITGITGATVTCTCSKNAGSFSTCSGAVTEISSGWYKLAGNSTDTGTLGTLAIHCTATSADPTDIKVTVVAFDPFDSVRMGVTALPNAAAEASGGLVTRGTGTGQISVSSGQVILQTGTGTGQLDFTSGVVKSNVSQYLGNAVPTADTAGYPKVTIKDGTGTGEIDTSSGAVVSVTTATTCTTASTCTALTTNNDKTGYSLSAAGAAAVRALVTGTADSGTTTTLVDDALTQADDDWWAGDRLCMTSGTLSGQCRLIVAFTASSDTITVVPAFTAAVATQTYEIQPMSRVDLARILGAAVSTSTAQLGVNAVQVGGQTASASGTVTFPAATLASTTNITVATGIDVTKVDGAALDTHDAGEFPADVRFYGGTAGTFASGRPEVNTTHWKGTAAATADTAGYPVVTIKDGTGAGEIDSASGKVLVSTADTCTTASTCTTTSTVGAGAITSSSYAAGAITAAAIADGAIDRATFATDTGLQSVRSGTAQAGGASTITLDASASATDQIYTDEEVYITGGTGAGEARKIRDYVGSTKVATVTNAWTTAPDNTSTFAVRPASSAWDEKISDHLDSGTTGSSLNAAGAAGDPWTTTLPGAYGAGTAGHIVGTALPDVAFAASGGLITRGTGTGQLSVSGGRANADAVYVDGAAWGTHTAGYAPADVRYLLGTAWLTPGTAGEPDVNVKHWNALTTVALPLIPTVAGRSLDVASTGEAGVDLSNVNGTLDASEIGADAITAAKIADGAIDAATFATGAIDAAAIAAGAITSSEAPNLDAAVSSRMATYTQPSGFLAATFPATVASTTNITAGTITTCSTATALGATAKTDVSTAVWDAATASYGAAGSYGLLVETDLDAAVSSRGTGTALDAAGVRAAVGLASANADTQLAAIQADTDNLQTRVPAALVSGRSDCSVGAYQSGQTPLQPTVSGRTLDVTTTGGAGIDWGNVENQTTTVALTNTTISASGGSCPTADAISDAVWDEAIAGHATAGSTGAKLSDASAAGNPMTADCSDATTYPGATTACGFIRRTVAKTDLLGSNNARVEPPAVGDTGAITIYRGRAYLTSIGTQLAFVCGRTGVSCAWIPSDLTGMTAQLNLHAAGGDTSICTCSIVTPAGTIREIDCDCSAAQTTALTSGSVAYDLSVYSGATALPPLRRGTCTIADTPR